MRSVRTRVPSASRSRRAVAHGHTLIELLAYMGGLTVLGGAVLAVIAAAEHDRRHVTGLAEDAESLRRAADLLGRDVRGASSVRVDGASLVAADSVWRLDGATLLRRDGGGEGGDERPVASRVAAFVPAIDADGTVHARIELLPRTQGVAHGPALDVVARRRVTGAVR